MKLEIKNQGKITCADFGTTSIGHYLLVYLKSNIDYEVSFGGESNGEDYTSRSFYFEGVGSHEGEDLGIVSLISESPDDQKILESRVLEHQTKNEIRFYFVPKEDLQESSLKFQPSRVFLC